MIVRRRTVPPHPLFREPLRLPSHTSGVDFTAEITAQYQHGRKSHTNLEEFVCFQVVTTVRKVAQKWEADERLAAQNEINAYLGEPHDCPQGFYRKLTGHAELLMSSKSRENAIRAREDRAHVARLRYLKTALYTDPSLLMIDYLDQNRDHISTIDVDRIEKFRLLADRLQEAEQWWSPIMAAWNELAANTKSREGIEEAMRVLNDSIRRLDSKLAARYKLPQQAQE